MAELLCLQIQSHFQSSHKYLKVHHSVQTHIQNLRLLYNHLETVLQIPGSFTSLYVRAKPEFAERAEKPHKILGNTVAVLCAAGARVRRQRLDWSLRNFRGLWRSSQISPAWGKWTPACPDVLSKEIHIDWVVVKIFIDHSTELHSPFPGLHKGVLSCEAGFYHSQIMLPCFLYTHNNPYLPSKIKFLWHCFRAGSGYSLSTAGGPRRWYAGHSVKSDVFQFLENNPFSHIKKFPHSCFFHMFLKASGRWADFIILEILVTETWVKASE